MSFQSRIVRIDIGAGDSWKKGIQYTKATHSLAWGMTAVLSVACYPGQEGHSARVHGPPCSN
eukprot:476834-Amphidinium_carterae.1